MVMLSCLLLDHNSPECLELAWQEALAAKKLAGEAEGMTPLVFATCVGVTVGVGVIGYYVVKKQGKPDNPGQGGSQASNQQETAQSSYSYLTLWPVLSLRNSVVYMLSCIGMYNKSNKPQPSKPDARRQEALEENNRLLAEQNGIMEAALSQDKALTRIEADQEKIDEDTRRNGQDLKKLQGAFGDLRNAVDAAEANQKEVKEQLEHQQKQLEHMDRKQEDLRHSTNNAYRALLYLNSRITEKENSSASDRGVK